MKKLNYEIINETLIDLLKIKDGDELPSLSGVCVEVGKAVCKPELLETQYRASVSTHEYHWTGQHAHRFNSASDSDSCYVDIIGIMTPKRREFIMYLLERIKEETSVSKEMRNDS